MNTSNTLDIAQVPFSGVIKEVDVEVSMHGTEKLHMHPVKKLGCVHHLYCATIFRSPIPNLDRVLWQKEVMGWHTLFFTVCMHTYAYRMVELE